MNRIKYFKTKSITLAYALNYLNFSFMKFQDNEGNNIYSFKSSEELYEKLEQLNDIKFS